MDGRGRVRAGESAVLGSYVEYAQSRLASVVPIAACLIVAAVLLNAAVTAGPIQTCSGDGHSRGLYHCTDTSAAENQFGAAVGALIVLGIAAFLALRRLTRPPCLRVGELGLEDRRPSLGSTVVLWSDVQEMPTEPGGPNARSVLVSFGPEAVRTGRAAIRIGLSGLAAEPADVLSEVHRRFRSASHLRAPEPDAEPRRRPDFFADIEIETGGDTLATVSPEELRQLVDHCEPGDFVTVLSRERGRDAFIQAMRTGIDDWDVEYRDAARHLQFAAPCLTNTEVYDAFVAWIERDPGLRRLLRWRQMADVAGTWPAVRRRGTASSSLKN